LALRWHQAALEVFFDEAGRVEGVQTSPLAAICLPLSRED
jgi:hypothetical protein